MPLVRDMWEWRKEITLKFLFIIIIITVIIVNDICMNCGNEMKMKK